MIERDQLRRSVTFSAGGGGKVVLEPKHTVRGSSGRTPATPPATPDPAPAPRSALRSGATFWDLWGHVRGSG